MDRNTLIATVLIMVVMLAWLWMMPQPEPRPAAPATPVDTTAAAAPAAPETPEPEPEARGLTFSPSAPAADTTIAGAQRGEARSIVVDTELYRATFSTRGATLTSFELKEYHKFDQATPVNLVDSTSPGAVALAFTTPQNHVVDTRSFFFETPVEQDTLRLTDEPVELAFESRVGSGRLRMVYTLYPDEYEVGLRVEPEGAASFSAGGGYELLWNGGIPFTEDSPETEGALAGAYARSGGEVVNVRLEEDSFGERTLRGSVSWVAVKSKYFTSVMMPETESVGAELVGERVGERGAPGYWEDYIVSLEMPRLSDEPDAFTLFVGPLEFYRITDYDRGLYDMVDYGWDFFEFMTRPLAKFVFIPAFTFLGAWLPSYGLVIIVMAILIKLAVYPLTKSSYKSMAKMRELQPKMEEIKEKYGDDPQKQQEAMMKMYKETGANPVGGCLPMLLQYPIIIALWQFLPQAIEIRQQGFLWAPDLSAPDVLLDLPFTIPVYGNFVAGFTLLMGLSMVVQMRLQSPGSNAQAKIMAFVFPIFIFAIFNSLAAGLSLYYLTYNIVTAIQQQWINRSLEKEDEDASRNGKAGKRDAAAARAKRSKRRKSKAKSS